MATDGGQIRIKDKVLAEQNHSKTCTSPNSMIDGKLIIGNNLRTLKPYLETNKRGIIFLTTTETVSFLQVPDGEAGYYKLLGTDQYGNLTWLDQEEEE